ncbi:MAG TPA: hypothetical protein VH912_14770 [Streptosporangiaceae bacterium]|jgi:hypothetical protein
MSRRTGHRGYGGRGDPRGSDIFATIVRGVLAVIIAGIGLVAVFGLLLFIIALFSR